MNVKWVISLTLMFILVWVHILFNEMHIVHLYVLVFLSLFWALLINSIISLSLQYYRYCLANIITTLRNSNWLSVFQVTTRTFSSTSQGRNVRKFYLLSPKPSQPFLITWFLLASQCRRLTSDWCKICYCVYSVTHTYSVDVVRGSNYVTLL